ncbi:MAG TPA: c-type cytochrome [Steroidobacteraceae bacterium]|nr:c-type cytochrome [Steroidobacteraceae bacterium]
MRGRAVIATLLGCAALGACARQAAAPAPVTSAAPPAVAYEAHLAAGGIAPPGGTLTNPHAGDAAVAKNGALLFTTMNCDGCHGGGGSGWVGPNLGDGRWRYGGSDAEVFSSIFYGRPKGMPAFGGVLGSEGVWTLVTYLRSLPLPGDLPTESWEQP